VALTPPSTAVEMRSIFGSTNFVVTAAPPAPPPAQDGHAALHFDGDTNRVSVANPNNVMNPYPFTVAAWVRTTQALSGQPTIAATYPSGDHPGWAFTLSGGALTGFYYANSSHYLWDPGQGISSRFVADGAWHFVAYTVDSTGGSLFRDGTLVIQVKWTGSGAPVIDNASLWFGYYPGDSDTEYAGDLDEVSLWNRALDAPALQSIMHQRLSGTEAGLVTCWHFDERSGTTAADTTGAHPATLLNTTSWIPSDVP